MGRNIWRPALLAAILLMAAALASCVKGEARLDVRMDGSADAALSIRLPTKAGEAAADVLERFGERLKAQGYETSTRTDGDFVQWSAARHYERSELQRFRTDGQGFQLDVSGFRVALTREDGWLYATYRLQGAFEVNELLGGDGAVAARYRALPPLARRLAERQIDLDFRLSLPIPPVDHNADASSRGGRTLVWHVSAAAETPFRIAVAAPNRRTPIAAGIALLLIAAGLGALMRGLRRRRKRKPKPKPPAPR